MKILYLLMTFFLLCQCSNNTKNNNCKENNDLTKNQFLTNTILSGVGESGVGGNYNDWTINILDSNFVEMLCSMKEDSLDERKMNSQYFGKIIPLGHYYYKVMINKTLIIGDREMSFHNYPNNDTVPFYFDSTLFKEVRYWDLEIGTNQKQNSKIRITNPLYKLYFPWDKDVIMTLYPEKGSIYYPITIKTGKKCRVIIGYFKPEMDYYLHKTNNGYELITDITPYRQVPKNCNYCIKKMNLKIKK